jgi:hypothetical protein
VGVSGPQAWVDDEPRRDPFSCTQRHRVLTLGDPLARSLRKRSRTHVRHPIAIATLLVCAVLSACVAPPAVDRCGRAVERVTLASAPTVSQAVRPLPGSGPGHLILSWQGQDGPVACEPTAASECGPPDEFCSLPMPSVSVGDVGVTELYLVNVSQGDLEVHVVDFSYDSCPALTVRDFEDVSIPPDGVGSATIVFAPTEVGPCEGWLEIYSDGSNIDTGFPTLVFVRAEGGAP